MHSPFNHVDSTSAPSIQLCHSHQLTHQPKIPIFNQAERRLLHANNEIKTQNFNAVFPGMQICKILSMCSKTEQEKE